MQRVPEQPAPAELLPWIAYERDAAWAAKLAILRLKRVADIAHFGACLREHDRHTDELGQLLRASDPRLDVRREPFFATRDPHAIGALSNAEAVIDAMVVLEEARIARYESRRPRRDREPHFMLDALLDRHAVDARQRLAWLRDRVKTRAVAQVVAA